LNAPTREQIGWVEKGANFDAAAADQGNKPARAESALDAQAKARLAFLSAQPAQGPPQPASVVTR